LGVDTQQGDDTVKLDFGLSSTMLSEKFRKAWPYDFGLLYTVVLTKESLETSLQVQNQGHEAFDFQTLFHTYYRIQVGLGRSSPHSVLSSLQDFFRGDLPLGFN
jgi:glucose-6-phosphate 1-epimerase